MKRSSPDAFPMRRGAFVLEENSRVRVETNFAIGVCSIEMIHVLLGINKCRSINE